MNLLTTYYAARRCELNKKYLSDYKKICFENFVKIPIITYLPT